MCGGIIYERTGTRNINYIRGLVSYMPVFTILFFILLYVILYTIKFKFFREQLSLIGIFEQNPIIASLAATSILLSACYSISFIIDYLLVIYLLIYLH